jgi:hypothetical protein
MPGNQRTLSDIGFIDNSEFLLMLGISREKARQLRASGEIRYCKIDKLIYYKISDVIEFMNAHFVRQ